MNDFGPTRVLHVLKAEGPLTAARVGQRLEMTAVGARQHLNRLCAAGLVTFEDRRQGIGRPQRLWSLSAQGEAHFDDRHRDLASELLNAIVVAHGEAGLDAILAAREAQQVRRYRESLSGARNVAERVQRLTDLRRIDGYMAECRAGDDGGWLMTEHHCPIAQAARACTGLCGAELHLFQQVLGEDVTVTRTQHMLGGDRCCAYLVEERANAN
ncbi:transcriptional regulator [Dongia mobilis]|uniref:Transcriptional regulator n=1 Tax=Dongia mobilis TaxID=578943 RepID=A0A4V3DEQ9_9PROT|nr:metalloregulator ArsR/SmtB family transcription factor [Dongia mobilis]TDQ81022.1 transcriptional regulator [Dongia mobilis]